MSVQWERVIYSSPPNRSQVSWAALKGQVRGGYTKNSQRPVQEGIILLLKVCIVTFTRLKPIPLLCPRPCWGEVVKVWGQGEVSLVITSLWLRDVSFKTLWMISQNSEYLSSICICFSLLKSHIVIAWPGDDFKENHREFTGCVCSCGTSLFTPVFFDSHI